MSRNRWTTVLAIALASLLAISEGFLLLGPKSFRSNQDYTVVMSSFDARFDNVSVLLLIEGHTDGNVTLNLKKTALLRRDSNTVVSFRIPPNLPRAHYSISLHGVHDERIRKQIWLDFLDSDISALIQLDKPVYKPGDSVQFRAIVLDSELKPPADLASVHVTVRDPDGNRIRKWSEGRLDVGVFEGDLQLAAVPLLGTYTITVSLDGGQLTSKAFEVKEYALSKIYVEVLPSSIPLLEHQALSLTVSAKYYVGQPVEGTAKVELFLEDDILDQSKTVDLYGKAQMVLKFNEPLVMYEDQQVVRVVATFSRKDTNQTIVKEQRVTVFKYRYRVELIKERPQFQPGFPFSCTIQVQHHDEAPATSVAAVVEVEGADHDNKQLYTTDCAGLIKLHLNPPVASQEIEVTVKIDGQQPFSETISARVIQTDTFIKVELDSAPTPHNPVRLRVTCNAEMSFFLYYVVAKGNIIESGFVRPNRVTKYALVLNGTENMLPKSIVIVATVAQSVVVQDSVRIDFEVFRNNFDLRIGAKSVEPGERLELRMTGQPGSRVSLAAYDKSLLQHGRTHDLFWEDILWTFDSFHAVDENQFDMFHTMGLFARSFGDIMFDVVIDQSFRVGRPSFPTPVGKLISFRNNFAESWLWNTYTIGPTGHTVVGETAPDSTTAWHLTGFSIHPVYGLGIIRRPIEFITTKPFYVVENLPYSIKRGETVELQFIIFNNYQQRFEATVTMYNVDNQTEFVGRSVNDASYSRSVAALPNAGVPVSFLVKAHKLGEMVVRVQAAIGPATDTIEQVVRVIPESLVLRKRESRFINHNIYLNQTLVLPLDGARKADNGSRKILCTLTPNLLTSVVDNLGNLLSVPSGCGEQNMVRFVPNLVVLDYLTAIGSKEKQLIKKATDLLRRGYQSQMKYRQPDGSFGVWAKSGGSVFLTAFVGKSLQAAAKYIPEVDAKAVSKLYDWLASKQHSTGRFDEIGKVIHKDMQGGLRNGIALTSYVLIAFLEHPGAAKKHAKAIGKGVRFVTGSLPKIGDAYDLSIATYALMLRDHASKNTFLQKLSGMSTRRNNGTEIYWDRKSSSIETTAYALLSYVLAEKYIEGTAIMRWLVNQRYATGSFPRTQDTFVGLKALTKLAEKISPTKNDYHVELHYGNVRKQFHVHSQDLAPLSHDEVADDVYKIEATVSGVGLGILDVDYEYSVDLRNFANRFTLELEKSLSNSGNTLQLRVCAGFIPQLTDTRSNMALVEVNFPSGYVVEQSPISEASKHNPIKQIETRFGGTSVVVYYDNMGTERNCFTVTAYRRAKVTLKRPAYVLVHDFYEPQLNAIEMYVVDS